MWHYTNTNELYHWGIKGQKWGVRRYQNPDGTLTGEGKKRYSQNVSSDHAKTALIKKKKVSEMSNDELKTANQRLQLERQYKDLNKKASIGKKAVQAFTSTAATITAVTAAAAVYKKSGAAALDKIGNAVVKSINLSGPLTG